MSRRRSPIRRRLLGMGVLLLAINGVAFASFTWPRLNSVRRAESRAREITHRKTALEALWSQVAARKDVVARNRQDIEVLSRDHLKNKSDDLFAAQREIEKLARAAGLLPRRSSYSLSEIKGTDLVRCEIVANALRA